MRNKKNITEQVSQTIDLERAINVGCFSDFTWFQIGRDPQPRVDDEDRKVVTGTNTKGEKIKFYEDGTVENVTTKNVMKWKCDKLSATVSKTSYVKNMTPDQEAYVNDIVKNEGVQKEKPSDYELGKGMWEQIDLYDKTKDLPKDDRNRLLFPTPNKFFVYKRVSAINTTTSQQNSIINAYKKDGWTDKEPDEIYKDAYFVKFLNKEKPKYFVTEFKMWKKKSDVDPTKYLKSVKDDFNSQLVERKQCRKIIDVIFMHYQKGVSFPDDATRDSFVLYAKRCIRQGVIPRSVSDEVKILQNIEGDPLSLKENINKKSMNLDKIIKKTLSEASDSKKRLLQEHKIVNARFNFILENVDHTTKKGQNEIFRNILSEMIYMELQGFDKKVISENVAGLFGVLSNLFGRSTSGIIDSFKEKGIQWIVEKLGWTGNSYMKNFLITSLGNVNVMDVPKLFTDCNYLTSKIAESIPEAYLRKLEYEKGIGGMFTDVVRNTLYDIIRNSDFSNKLEASIAHIVCPIVTKLTGIFSNKLSGMKTKLVGA